VLSNKLQFVTPWMKSVKSSQEFSLQFCSSSGSLCSLVQVVYMYKWCTYS